MSSCSPAAAASNCTVACGGGDLSRTSALYGGQTVEGDVSSGEASSALPRTSLPAGTITIGGDLTVGRMGFGAMQLTGDQVWGEYADHDGALLLLRHVVDAGVNFLDTADVYGPHSNE